jgi:hypothetical protein
MPVPLCGNLSENFDKKSWLQNTAPDLLCQTKYGNIRVKNAEYCTCNVLEFWQLVSQSFSCMYSG